MANSKKNRIYVFLKDKRKKSIPKMLKELMYLWITKKEIPFYYFKYLYRKEVTNYKDYLSTKECRRIQFYPDYHKDEYVNIMADKLKFSIFCDKNNLPIPKLISYNLDSVFFYDGNKFPIKNKESLIAFFNHVFQESNYKSIFIKPLSLFGGKGCFKIDKATLEEDINQNGDSLIENNCIHEEVIVQHNAINKIHSDCINTIRIETYIDKKGTIHNLSGLMRFGVGNSVIDNSHAGGFFVSIDLEAGSLGNVGRQFAEFGGGKLTKHPDSDFVFGGFKLPYFKEICDLTIKATTYLPDRYIGWDIAISNDGPVIIEANERTNVSGADYAYGGYMKHPLFKEIIEETKNFDLSNSYNQKI
ncbi:MAG: hypothetical protein L3J14_01810 [Flavobacteriaceae bacterium]|nr:hypothetical protein [Flavobacteriaceae bacterium]